MNPDSSEKSSRIRARQVRVLDHPVLLGGQQTGHKTMSVTPVLERGSIRYLRIQCGCGQTLDIECLYPQENPEEDTPKSEPPKPETPS